jgi:non-homologous end joining protein Ku
MRPHDAETAEELERNELVRGYEFSKCRCVVLAENELEAIDPELSGPSTSFPGDVASFYRVSLDF